ncbi:MAG TPA: LEA type 2 family protein [Gemmatimonadales bacterium]|jgi:LEA14-like dessication related protein|nr:LEA type 2 family protein [Gemmatimonadales bacterium]
MTRRLAAWLLLGPAAALAGCSGIPDNFRDPEIQLNQVILRGAGLTGGTMDLVVNVRNPNGFDLRGTKLQVGFDVEGSHVGDVTYQDEFQVRKNDTTVVTLPVRFNWAGVGAAVRSAVGYGDIPYTMRGQATIRTPFGNHVVAFTREGRAPLTRGAGGILPSGTAAPGSSLPPSH